MNWFLKLLERMGRKVTIMDREDNEPYLDRYYVFLRDRKWFPFNVFLHRFHKSDPDDVHDHPWPYATLILKGGYYEWVPAFNHLGERVGETRYWRGPLHFRVCRPSSFHRIELVPGVTCWTLFMPGPQMRNWGFLVNKTHWMDHESYFAWRRSRKANSN